MTIHWISRGGGESRIVPLHHLSIGLPVRILGLRFNCRSESNFVFFTIVCHFTDVLFYFVELWCGKIVMNIVSPFCYCRKANWVTFWWVTHRLILLIFGHTEVTLKNLRTARKGSSSCCVSSHSYDDIAVQSCSFVASLEFVAAISVE